MQFDSTVVTLDASADETAFRQELFSHVFSSDGTSSVHLVRMTAVLSGDGVQGKWLDVDYISFTSGRCVFHPCDGASISSHYVCVCSAAAPRPRLGLSRPRRLGKHSTCLSNSNPSFISLFPVRAAPSLRIRIVSHLFQVRVGALTAPQRLSASVTDAAWCVSLCDVPHMQSARARCDDLRNLSFHCFAPLHLSICPRPSFLM